MPRMDDVYMAYARQRQAELQRDAEHVRLARRAKRAARQRAAREDAEIEGGVRPAPSAGGAHASPRRLRLPHRVVAWRRAAGYALLEAGLRLLTPPSRQSRVGSAGVAGSVSARRSDSR